MRITRRRSLLLPAALAGSIAAPHVARSTFFLPQTFAPVPFNPTQLITGFGGFWRADVGLTLSGSNVTAWADQSSQGTSLTLQTFGGAQISPVFSATGFNAAFSAVTIRQDLASLGGLGNIAININSTQLSFFMLGVTHPGFDNNNGRFGGVVGNGQTVDFNNTSSFEFDEGASPTGSPGYNIQANSAIQGNGGVQGPQLIDGTTYLLGGVFDGVNANKWINRAVVGTGTAYSNTIGGGTSTVTFGYTGTGLNASINCGFWGITNSVLTATDFGNLCNFANSNWGTSL